MFRYRRQKTKNLKFEGWIRTRYLQYRRAREIFLQKWFLFVLLSWFVVAQ